MGRNNLFRGMLVNRGRFPQSCQMLFHCGLIKFIRLALFYGDGVHRAVAQTGAQSVTEIIGCQHRLAVNDLDGPFGAGWDALSAAVAFIRIDSNYFP
jgi:hypothetical protein